MRCSVCLLMLVAAVVLPGCAKTEAKAPVPVGEFGEVDMLAVEIPDGKAVPIIDGKATVEGSVVDHVELPKSVRRLSTAVVHFRNTSNESASPAFSGIIYNRYGMRLALFNVHWLTSLNAGDVYVDNASMRPYEWAEAFDHATIAPPADAHEPAFLVVTGEVY